MEPGRLEAGGDAHSATGRSPARSGRKPRPSGTTIDPPRSAAARHPRSLDLRRPPHDVRKGRDFESVRPLAAGAGGHHRHGLPVSPGGGPGAVLGQHPQGGRRDHRGARIALAAATTTSTSDPKAADRTYARRGGFHHAGGFPADGIRHRARTPSRRPTRPSSSACSSPARPWRTPAMAPDRDCSTATASA